MEFKEKGNKEYAAGNWEAAAELFTRALAVDPDFGVCLANRAACWIHLGRWSAGLSDCEAALTKSLAPQVKVKVYWRKAKCLQALGRPVGETLVQLRALDPDNKELHAMLQPVPVVAMDSLPAFSEAPAPPKPSNWTPPGRPIAYATIQSLLRQKRPEADDFAFSIEPQELVAAHRGIGIDPEVIDYYHGLIAARGGAHGAALLRALKSCDRYSSAEFLADETLAAAASKAVS